MVAVRTVMSSAPREPGSIVSPAILALAARDPWVRANAVTVHHGAEGTSRLSLTVREDMLNAHGICHGGIVFALGDTALAYAGGRDGAGVVTTTATINFLAPSRLGDVLTARCTPVHEGARSGVRDVEVTSQDGVLVAVLRGATLTKSLAAPVPVDHPGQESARPSTPPSPTQAVHREGSTCPT